MASLSGEWKLVNGGTAAVGTEKWKLEETSSSFDYSSTIVRKTPFPHREELRVKATMRSWELQDIEISTVADSPSDHPSECFSGNKRNGSFEVESSRGGILERASVPVSDSTEFDYLSPIFNTITFHRLRLRRRQTREIEAFFIFPV